MISRPANWIAVHGVTTQTLIAPEGADAAAIRYTERVRPLMRLGDIVKEWLRRHSKINLTSVGEPERLKTAEGEDAALVTINGSFGDTQVQASLGVVFLDDFYARVEGFALREDLFESTHAMVRELTTTDAHSLGRRRRRYAYTSPESWQPIARGFTTDWVAPEFPLKWGMIVAYAGAPIEPGTDVDLGALATRATERGFVAATAAPPREVENTHRLHGLVNEMTGSDGEIEVLRSFVTLTDQRYMYSAELLSRTGEDWPAHREAFTAMWMSILPIPSPSQANVALPFEFWAE